LPVTCTASPLNGSAAAHPHPISIDANSHIARYFRFITELSPYLLYKNFFSGIGTIPGGFPCHPESGIASSIIVAATKPQPQPWERWVAGYYSRPLLFRSAIKLLKTSATTAPRTVAGVLFAWVAVGDEPEANDADTDSVLPAVACTLVDQSL
jgi:hypothetical protein